MRNSDKGAVFFLLPQKRTFKQIYNKIVAKVFRYSITGFPWYLSPNDQSLPEMSQLRRIARRQIGRRNRLPLFVNQACTALLWPIGVLWVMYYVYRHPSGEGPALIKEHGYAMIMAALKHNVIPGDYLMFGLTNPDNYRKIDNYLYRNEALLIFGFANRGVVDHRVNDKLKFYKFCIEQNLSTVSVLSVIDHNLPDQRNIAQLPVGELWTKPALGNSAGKSQQWTRSENEYIDEAGKDYSHDLWVKHLTGYSQLFGPMLVQPLLRNHLELEPFTDGSVVVARLITGGLPGRRPLVHAAYLTLRNDKGDLFVGINVETGKTGPVTKLDRLYPHYQVEAFALSMVPDWACAVKLATDVHERLGTYSLLGQDIALTEEGPKCLEVNAGWTTIEPQVINASSFPEMSTDWARLLRELIDQG